MGALAGHCAADVADVAGAHEIGAALHPNLLGHLIVGAS